MIKHSENPLVFNTAIGTKKRNETVVPKEVLCPFCDVENLTGILKTSDHKIWLKNKFPTLKNSMMTVIIESDEHLGDISTYGVEENREVFSFAFECWDEMIQSGKYQSVLMFKNFDLLYKCR